jgi:hypothetical protein
MKKLILASALSLISPIAFGEVTQQDLDLVQRCAKAADLSYFTITQYTRADSQVQWVNATLETYEKRGTLGKEDPSRKNVESAWAAVAGLVHNGVRPRGSIQDAQWLTSYATGTCIMSEKAVL